MLAKLADRSRYRPGGLTVAQALDDPETEAVDDPSTVTEPDFVSVAEIAAEMALIHSDKVETVELTEHEWRTFRRRQRRILGREPQVRHLVASRVLPPRPRPRDAGPAPVRRRGSRRGSRSPPDDEGESDEPPGGRLPHDLTAGAAA
jgi:hypothetical protein